MNKVSEAEMTFLSFEPPFLFSILYIYTFLPSIKVGSTNGRWKVFFLNAQAIMMESTHRLFFFNHFSSHSHQQQAYNLRVKLKGLGQGWGDCLIFISYLINQ